MASSDTAQISTIVDLVQLINPSSILDVGCGYGKYGYLFREYLMGELWDKNKTTINAVEGYSKYITDMQRTIYNEIYICDAMNFPEYMNRRYDLISIIDAFEHLTDDDGKIFIKKALENSHYLLISIPRFVSIQQGYSDDPNKFEEHRSFWTSKMFKAAGNCIIIPNNARKTIVLYSKDGTFSNSIRKFCNKKLYFKFIPYIVADAFNYLNWFVHRNNRNLFLKKSNVD